MPVRVAGKAITDLGYLHTRVNIKELFGGEHPKIYTELDRALDASEQYLNDSDTVIFASATIKRILIIFQTAKQKLPNTFWNTVILHVKRVWDFTADCVCYDAVETFTILLSLHLGQCLDCLERPATDSHDNCDRINEVTQWLLEPTTLCKSRFKCITHLVEQCPTLRLNLGEDFFRRIYPLLVNPSLSAVICQLIVGNIYYRDDLWDLHCDLLLQISHLHDAKLIKTRLIPMLQKYHPTLSPSQEDAQKPDYSALAIAFLKRLLGCLNNSNPTQDLQSYLEIAHALVTTTWPRKHVKEDVLNQVDFSHWNQCVSESIMSEALFHVDAEVRLMAFRLLVETPRKTMIFNETDLDFIKMFLDSNMIFQAPSARHSLVAAYKLMCQRLGASADSYLRSKPTSERESEKSFSPEVSTFGSESRDAKWRTGSGADSNVHPVPESYVELVRWLAKLAFESLSPKGNYYRRIMALMQINVLFSKENFITDNKRLFVDLLNLDRTLASDRHKLVVDCLDDSYELVQSTALGLLKKLDFGIIKLDAEYIKAAMDLLNSTRSKNLLSAGYRIQYYLIRHPEKYTTLLEQLLAELKSRTDSSEAELMIIIKSSLHQIMFLIVLLLKNQTSFGEEKEVLKFYRDAILDQIIPICHRIVRIVTPVVHNLSPEGYIPEEFMENLSEKSTEALAGISQHLLVCCWRAHREVSGMFAWISDVLAPKGIVTKEEIEAMGTFYWNQLTECKHRGAFESATEGFTQLCKFLWNTPDDNLPKPIVWLEEILSAIRGEKDLTNLCSTRRSAGLPHLVLAIVSTEPKSHQNAALIRAADSLLDMDGKPAEYRIHSMNVMKTLVQNSALNERITFCLERTLRVAIDACRADWSERNAASQLFAALRTRIFGVTRSAQRGLEVDQKNRQSNYEFFSKFPTLYTFLYDLLQIEQSDFSLLPPLVLLTHLYTPASSTELYPLRPFIPLLLDIALHKNRENLRSHAVAAILAISDSYAKEDLCNWLEHFKCDNARQNHIHSFLMLVDGLSNTYEYAVRASRVIEALVKPEVFKTWNDYNINLLLTIANRLAVAYDKEDVPMSRICLSKRPLAEKLLQDRDVFMTEIGGVLKDADTRREVYRAIAKNSWEVCTCYLRPYITDIAIKDLSGENVQQCDAKMMMKILSEAPQISDQNREKLMKLLLIRLEDPNLNWTLPSTMAYAMKLKYANLVTADDDLISWIRECYDLDDPETKTVALEIGGSLILKMRQKQVYNGDEKVLISAISIYLQDELEYIRQTASMYLGHLVKSDDSQSINPAICRLLIAQCLNDGKGNFVEKIPAFEEKPIDDRDDLFDACAVNQYAEYAYFGDIKLYDSNFGVYEGDSTLIYDFDV